MADELRRILIQAHYSADLHPIPIKAGDYSAQRVLDQRVDREPPLRAVTVGQPLGMKDGPAA